ncbi:DNA mismatch repair endonuclease MutL [Scytonema sp. UIC 10036]|uniref:DNA mismatch repair endonuclease MutL n=1 Tax=Scytonema sp. UIC 10036 TaxID=2304196 RepID=UPI001FAB2ED5|nr:DNA mismatch repair endonuclease MutL [Scytonema sp. UIC 10036]
MLCIQALPTEVVHLITAGEVIDSLASVVRELVENSLDAGATRIAVSLWPQQWRVRVVDNGCGMPLEDLQRAATAHSTSKIRQCADLWKITSLGFRGEALHSLTTLADLEILSRPHCGDGGWRIVYGYGGEARHIEAAAIAPGTIVTVSNLFENWSSRREGLPPTAQQMKAVQATIQQIALCHPHVTWQVCQNDREWFSICPSSAVAQLLPQIVHQIKESDLHELKLEIPNPNDSRLPPPDSLLSLVIGLPDRCHRRRPDWVKVAINKRMVKSQELEQTILTGFHRTLPRDRYPVCFLHLFVPPEQVNWNRNPAKSEIYLNHLNHWQEQISQAIDKALRLNSTSMGESAHTTRVINYLKKQQKKNPHITLIHPTPTRNPLPPHSLLTDSPQHKSVAQVNNTYIVANIPVECGGEQHMLTNVFYTSNFAITGKLFLLNHQLSSINCLQHKSRN